MLLAALALAACASGAGPARPQPDCTSNNALTQVSGECERTLDSLAEPKTEHIAVPTTDIQPYATVEYEVRVQTGSVIVVFSDVEQSELTAQAMPGQPARGQARVRLDPLNQINFGLAPVEGAASGITYHVKYVCECMP